MTKRVCFVGDSQIMSVIRAVRQGMLDDRSEEIEFFGAQGPRFRMLRFVDGRIVPEDEALENVAVISSGRLSLGPDDFDAFVFFGGRLNVVRLLFPLMHYWASPDHFLSEAASREMIAHWMLYSRNFRYGRDFAKAGAKVVVVPATLTIEGFQVEEETLFPRYADATVADYERAMSMMKEIVESNGAGFVGQPADTMSEFLFTDPKYAIEGAREKRDGTHKSEELSAMIARMALEKLYG